MFRKILIANRGEIAVRVTRACREMGIASVAVYSEVERKALHVRYADEAYLIGPAPSTGSYLRIDRILDVARRSGAEAIHPGYGFLAENQEFARACRDAGLIFIGPPVEAMELMGSKTASRHALVEAGLPVVPGTDRNVESLDEVRRLADDAPCPEAERVAVLAPVLEVSLAAQGRAAAPANPPPSASKMVGREALLSRWPGGSSHRT